MTSSITSTADASALKLYRAAVELRAMANELHAAAAEFLLASAAGSSEIPIAAPPARPGVPPAVDVGARSTVLPPQVAPPLGLAVATRNGSVVQRVPKNAQRARGQVMPSAARRSPRRRLVDPSVVNDLVAEASLESRRSAYPF